MIDIAIILIIISIPIGLLLMAFIVAMGKRPGNRRRRTSDMNYDGPERRCAHRKNCPSGFTCRDPSICPYTLEQRINLPTNGVQK